MSASSRTRRIIRHTDTYAAVCKLACPLARAKRTLWVGDMLGEREAPLAAVAGSLRAYSKHRPTARLSNTRARPLTDEGIRIKPGSAEVIVIPDTMVLPAPLGEHLPAIRNGLSDDGVLVFGIQIEMTNAALADLRESVSAHFEHIEVLGFAPFVGWTLASLQHAAPTLLVDDSLLEASSPAPTHLVVIASHAPINVDAVTLVLAPLPPPDEPGTQSTHEASPKNADRMREIEEMRVEASSHVAELEAALEETAAQVQTLRGELAAAQDGAPSNVTDNDVQADFALLELKLTQSAARIREIELELDHRAVLVRDLLEEMGKRDRTPTDEAPAEAPATPAVNDDILQELRDFLANALVEQGRLPAAASPLSDATLVGMQAPVEWADGPPGGLDGLRARLDWVRSRAQIDGPAKPTTEPTPEGPIQLATLPPQATADTSKEADLDEFGQELMLLHERLAQLDDEIEQERHTRQSLQAEVERLESADAASALTTLKEELRQIRDEVESAHAGPGPLPDLGQLRDRLRALADS